MRALQTHDVFIAMNIINTAGIREEFEKMALKVSNNERVNVQQVGIEFLLSVLGGCANEKSENLIYKFLGGIMEKDAEEIKTQDPMQTIKDIKSMMEVVSTEEWKSFFTSLRGVLNL